MPTEAAASAAMRVFNVLLLARLGSAWGEAALDRPGRGGPDRSQGSTQGFGGFRRDQSEARALAALTLVSLRAMARSMAAQAAARKLAWQVWRYCTRSSGCG